MVALRKTKKLATPYQKVAWTIYFFSATETYVKTYTIFPKTRISQNNNQRSGPFSFKSKSIDSMRRCFDLIQSTIIAHRLRVAHSRLRNIFINSSWGFDNFDQFFDMKRAPTNDKTNQNDSNHTNNTFSSIFFGIFFCS